MGGEQDRAAGRLVDAARLHPDEAVLDQVEPADAVVVAELVEAGEQGRRRQRLAVDRDGIAALEVDLDDRRLVRRVLGRDACAGGHIRAPRRAGSSSTFPSEEEWRRLASIEKGASPLLSLLIGIWCFSAKSISCSRLAIIPFAPGGDHPDVGLQRIIAELEADLVVALAGGAVADRVGADLRARSRSGAWRSSGRAIEVPSRYWPS